MSFDDPTTAAEVRDTVKKIAQKVVNDEAPKPTYGRVMSVDFAALTCTVWFPGDPAPVKVNLFSSTLPGDWSERYGKGSGGGVPGDSLSGYGAQVIVQNFRGKQYITGVLNGGQFSEDWVEAGSKFLAYSSVDGTPYNVYGADYLWDLFWDTSVLPRNGGPYCINIGPFTPDNTGQPDLGTHELDVLREGGQGLKLRFNTDLFYLTSKANTGSPDDRWYRVIPEMVSEDYILNNSGAQINSTNIFYQTVGDWSAITGCTISASTDFSNSGTGYSLKVVSNAGGVPIGAQTPTANGARYPVIAGANYAYTYDGYSPTVSRSAIRFSIDWYNSSNSIISTTNQSNQSLTANTWATKNGNATAPAGAVTAVFRVMDNGTPTTGQPVYFDNVKVTAGDSVGKSQQSVDVAIRKTAHGAQSGNPADSYEELWIRIFIHWMDGHENPTWRVRYKNTGSWSTAKSLVSKRPIVEFVTSGVTDAVGYLGYHDANFGPKSDTSPPTFLTARGDWSTGPWTNPDLLLARRAQDVLTGGGRIKWNGTNFGWSKPFEVGGIGRSRHGLMVATATITQPTSGTIPVFPGNGTVTAVSGGIPLTAGQSLWFGIPPGLASSTIPAQSPNGGLHTAGTLFIMDNSSLEYMSPPLWAVFVAYRGSDTTQAEIKCGNGNTYDKWRALSLANSWTGTFQYRWYSSNSIQINVSITPGTKTNGTAVTAALPSDFFPTNATDIEVATDVQAAGQSPHLNFTTGGVFNCWGLTGAGAASTNKVVPLDN